MKIARAVRRQKLSAGMGGTVGDKRSSRSLRFERAVLPHLDAAYTLARYLTREPADAEDAVQDAVLRAIKYFDTLRAESDARAWLLAIVRRECYELSSSRRRAREEVPYDEAPPLRLVDPTPSPESEASSQILRARVLSAVDLLPDALRETLILREIEQCTYEEIASITEAPVGTVMSRLSRARARVANALRAFIDVGEVS